MKVILMVLILLAACSCDIYVNKKGSLSETCFNGVVYLQFPSNTVVALDKNGMPLTCEN